MKRGRLPLTALRSFEAAGRHVSFSKAAEELFVSQAAISRQIRELETFLRQPLFERHHRRVELTDAGRRLLAQLVRSFDAIDRLVGDLAASPAQFVVRVSVEPSLAAVWLVPRLNRFRQLRPDIDVSLEVDPRLIEFRSDQPELALRFSSRSTSWPRSEAERLASTVDSPVLSPALLSSGPTLEKPADLARFTLLHEENRQGWARWFEAAGVPADAVPARGPMLADASLSKQAALLGHGVALGDILQIGEELATGALVKPFDIDVASGAYWLVARSLHDLSEPAAAFAEWLRGEFADSRKAVKAPD
ncbi:MULTISPECIES: LysR substrate-binding domain-containing protein [unclassified Mesorhizobium]|uniref:LysR substrate-binding domain-containing protein n=1 Tax=unclassified Mesorhizobium TaxID=325217 RepID=UPI000FD2805A|nr:MULTISPECIES: LysR substrate-binding domain-containing protein [unclassified Mesorhizobium]RUW96634.1 LysR family transcriptional regulator [Mesorhizobium sp. M8A.F.Ca.ET.023.01.1.1]RWC78019.1 MAG: LysR family transcriptional regulator [Mesorhizobium sp.]TGR38927.1 LysR family transcriptional regulator [bacterium M00.F.Ca.ET.199.01.1.1]TGU27539.1 LysR family transcriptional regulator [bacterium M00.F.Ca.ET.156.01.1.1]TGV16507.1 LysR family transcriptional regulator [Mesorhizobium sp. M8A.F.